MTLSERDVQGIQCDSADQRAKPRLVVLDVTYPPRIWVLDGCGLTPGKFSVASRADMSKDDEAREIADRVGELLRTADCAILEGQQGDANVVKSVITKAIGLLGWPNPRVGA